MLVISKTKDESVLLTALTVFKECLSKDLETKTVLAISQYPQNREFFQLLLEFSTKDGTAIVQKISEISLVIIGELIAINCPIKFEKVFLIDMNLSRHLLKVMQSTSDCKSN